MALSQRQIFFARIAVFAFVAVVCFWRLGSMPLLETDEGFAANRAASFYRHHTWRLSFDDVDDDNPQFRKPQLLYWTVAALYPVLGHNMWAVRLPGAAAALGLCWILYRISRRHFCEEAALGSVVLFISVPFVLFHVRTAMLEIPLIALTFAAVYALAYLPDDDAENLPTAPGEEPAVDRGTGSAVLAGLAAAGAVLIKGSPGFLAIGVAVLYALALNKFSVRALRRAGIAIAVVAAIFAVYALWVVPHHWRSAMLESMFVKEGTHRTTAFSFADRFHSVRDPLWATAPFLLIIAAIGAVILIGETLRRPRGDAASSARTWISTPLSWCLLMLLIAAPVIWVGAKQVVPFPRYFIPVYPFLAALAAFAIVRIVRRTAIAATVIIAVATLTFFWPTARNCDPSQREMPYRGMEELAGKVPMFVMEGDKVILAAGKLKCHQLLFYGGRAIASEMAWLLNDFKPGAIRYAVVRANCWVPPPLVHAEKLDEIGMFELLRLRVSTSRPEVAGILLCKHEQREALAAALKKQGRAFEPFENGFLLLKK